MSGKNIENLGKCKEHCWHIVGFNFQSDDGKADVKVLVKCCWCGNKEEFYDHRTSHGDHLSTGKTIRYTLETR